MKGGLIVAAFVICFPFCGCRIRGFGEDNWLWPDPDLFGNVSTLISGKGYPLEEHTVQTLDGFLLGLQRIPHGRKSHFYGGKRKAVLLQHGLLSCSSGFVLNFEHDSLGFILADAGYDVWLGNTRGNTYSRQHVKYTPSDAQFWDYSFSEMGEYDLPAMIDYILNVTNQKQLYYIGHSQGTTAAFALLSERPEYNKKIKLFIAMAPVATVGHVTSALSYIAPFANNIDFVLKYMGVNEFFPSNTFMKFLTEIVCEAEEKFLCKDIIFVICGSDKAQLNETRLGVYSVQLLGGTSTKSLVHYAQMVNSKVFSKYDYGKEENMKRYNQTTPPKYDVSRITTPVSLAWSLNDQLADPTDVEILEGKLKSMVTSYCVPYPEFSHLDFIIAMNVREQLYDHILSELANH